MGTSVYWGPCNIIDQDYSHQWTTSQAEQAKLAWACSSSFNYENLQPNHSHKEDKCQTSCWNMPAQRQFILYRQHNYVQLWRQNYQLLTQTEKSPKGTSWLNQPSIHHTYSHYTKIKHQKMDNSQSQQRVLTASVYKQNETETKHPLSLNCAPQ